MASAEARLTILRNGFVPTPCAGKAAVAKGWQAKIETNAEEIRLWDRLYPHAQNTGILCQRAPALDIDITVQPAAEAVEQLAREEFEERGPVLVRVGKPPKRAIMLRTDEPFDKLAASFTAPDGSSQKIEFLANGQQIVVDGVHPDTGKPYSWHGGSPLTTSRDELPYIRRDDAVAFLDRAAALLEREFGFTQTGATRKQNGQDTDNTHGRADWAELIGNILAGRDLHDSVTRLAAGYVATGMDDSAAIRSLEALMLASSVPHDERWKARLGEIPRAVRSAREKLWSETQTPRETAPQKWSWRFFGRQDETIERAYLVDKLLPENGVGLISGQWRTYKTFVALDLAAAVITGTPFAGFEVVRQGAALFIALEGQGEVNIRLQAALAHRGYAKSPRDRGHSRQSGRLRQSRRRE